MLIIFNYLHFESKKCNVIFNEGIPQIDISRQDCLHRVISFYNIEDTCLQLKKEVQVERDYTCTTTASCLLCLQEQLKKENKHFHTLYKILHFSSRIKKHGIGTSPLRSDYRPWN